MARSIAALLVLACLAGGAAAAPREVAPIARHYLPLPPPAGPAPGPRYATGTPRPYSGTPVTVKSYHYHAGQTGWNARETDLTTTTVASASFGQIAVIPVDGLVLPQPLLDPGVLMPDGLRHDVLVVATNENSLYAFDAQTYAVLWQVNFGPPQSAEDVGCDDAREWGISSTPVIVHPAASHPVLYVVAATEPTSMAFHHQLHAIDLTTGADIVPPVEIAPSAAVSGGTVQFDPRDQYNRAALAYRAGSLYVGIGGHCEIHDTDNSGWLLRYDANLNLLDLFNTVQMQAGYELAGVWMSGSAPAIDAQGNVFVVTGNGYFSQTPGALGFGESAISFTPDLKVRSTFTPDDWAKLNNGDQDFGSGGIVLLPQAPGQTAPPMAVAMGKVPTLYLLNQNVLGGEQANDAGALWHRTIGTGNGLWGEAAYYADATGGIVYIQKQGDVLRAFRVETGATPRLSQIATGTIAAGLGGSMPIVSSNGSKPGTAIVWLVHRGTQLTLEAYDAETVGKPIFSAAAGTWTSNENAFVSPMEANGRVYVGGDKTVTVFGLTQ